MTTIGPGVERMLGFDGVNKRFGSLTALDGCTFAARPGRLTGFLGPNGAGKTTAMRAATSAWSTAWRTRARSAPACPSAAR